MSDHAWEPLPEGGEPDRCRQRLRSASWYLEDRYNVVLKHMLHDLRFFREDARFVADCLEDVGEAESAELLRGVLDTARDALELLDVTADRILCLADDLTAEVEP